MQRRIAATAAVPTSVKKTFRPVSSEQVLIERFWTGWGGRMYIGVVDGVGMGMYGSLNGRES